MSKIPISVIILTFNEEKNILRALDSILPHVEQVLVVDSYSTDATVDLVLGLQADNLSICQHAFENYSAQWNWALKNLPISQPWTLKLDADECATPAFLKEVAKKLAQVKEGTSGFVVHWRNIFMGRWLRWGGLYPNGNVRIWRSGVAAFGDREVNEHLHINGDVGVISEPIDHCDFKSLSEWLDKHNRYSSMEARSIIQGKLHGSATASLRGRPEERRSFWRRLYLRIPLRELLYFFYRFVFRLGFLDGIPGFRFCFLHAVYMYWISLKVAEYHRTGDLPVVMWPARGQPHPRLSGTP